MRDKETIYKDCVKLFPYTSRESAEKAQRKHLNFGFGQKEIYSCPVCSFFHLRGEVSPPKTVTVTILGRIREWLWGKR
jgi:hypothetical protein